MAHNNIEIEIKIQLSEQDFSKVKEKLKQLGKFVKTSKQEDEYFTPTHRNFVEPKFPFEWLSIRKRGGKSILNYKHWHPENAEITTHCDEFETEITSPESLNKIFSSLNLTKLISVEKEREVYTYNNEFEVGLDSVSDLGKFIEIETIKDFGTVEKARERLFEFAKFLGVDISNPDKRGYPYLMLKKKGLII